LHPQPTSQILVFVVALRQQGTDVGCTRNPHPKFSFLLSLCGSKALMWVAPATHIPNFRFCCRFAAARY
ncbi:MAG: hypothetical protein LBF64_03400, partial [Oscillospiraceae bacterium]|nr:hypothetical protein [Oscillospiraceae bacterium]